MNVKSQQTTLIILKPDAVQRGLTGTIINRFEAKGLKIVGAKLMIIGTELAERHYAVHKGKPFYDGLIEFMTGSPVMVLAIRGPEAIDMCRKMMGATFCTNAEPGTIRGDLGTSTTFNLIHGSDSPESAARELELFFTNDQLFDYDCHIERWVKR